MRGNIRAGTCLIVLAVGLAGAALSGAGWSRAAQLLRRGGGPKATVVLAEPAEASRIAMQRLRAKEKVVARLLAGGLTLPEAAAWFRHINDHPARSPCDFRRTMPGRGDGEKACRQVLAWAEGQVPKWLTPSQAELLLCRLDAELDALLAHGRDVELPW